MKSELLLEEFKSKQSDEHPIHEPNPRDRNNYTEIIAAFR